MGLRQQIEEEEQKLEIMEKEKMAIIGQMLDKTTKTMEAGIRGAFSACFAILGILSLFFAVLALHK